MNESKNKNQDKEGLAMESMFSRKGKWLIICLSVILLTAMGSFGATAAEKEILIGVLEPMSGGSALTGANNSRGYKMAVDEINSAGGIKSMGGAKLKLMIQDHQGKPNVGIAETERLVRKGASVIMGGWHSSVILPSTQIAEQLKIPFVVVNSTMDKITERGFKYVFRTLPKASKTSQVRAEYVQWMNKHSKHKAKRVAVIAQDSVYGTSTASGDKKFAEQAGLEVVAYIIYPVAARDLSVEVRKLIASKPDVVMWTPYETDAIMMTRLFAEEKFAPHAIIGYAFLQNPKYIKQLGKITEYVCTLTAWNPDVKLAGARELNEKYKKLYGDDMDGTITYTYSGIYVVKDVLERAGSTDKEKIRKALTKTNLKPGKKGIVWPYGVKFGPDGQNKFATICIAQILNGQKQTIWPRKYAPVKPVWPIPKWEGRK